MKGDTVSGEKSKTGDEAGLWGSRVAVKAVGD